MNACWKEVIEDGGIKDFFKFCSSFFCGLLQEKKKEISKKRIKRIRYIATIFFNVSATKTMKKVLFTGLWNAPDSFNNIFELKNISKIYSDLQSHFIINRIDPDYKKNNIKNYDVLLHNLSHNQQFLWYQFREEIIYLHLVPRAFPYLLQE